MILRRLSTAVRKQDWFTVAVETLIVVFGVFIGLQVNNWNERRAEQAASIGYLASMENDVLDSIRALETAITYMESDQAARLALYHYSVDPDAVLEPTELNRLLRNGFYMVRPVLISQVTFETLKSSGKIETLSAPKLVAELQAINVLLEEDKINQADAYNTAQSLTDPMLIAHFDMLNILRQPSIKGGPYIAWVPQATKPPAPEPAIIKTLRFANITLHRANVEDYRLRVIRELLAKNKHVATLIDERQAELGDPHDPSPSLQRALSGELSLEAI